MPGTGLSQWTSAGRETNLFRALAVYWSLTGNNSGRFGPMDSDVNQKNGLDGREWARIELLFGRRADSAATTLARSQ